MTPEALPDPLRVALAASGILDRLGIPYVITGSFASSVHGEPRSTDDVDVVADVRPVHVSPLTAALAAEWYVSEQAMREAIDAGTPCHPEPTALQRAQSRSEEFMREAKDLKALPPLVSQHPLLSVTQFTCRPCLRLWHAACRGCTILIEGWPRALWRNLGCTYS